MSLLAGPQINSVAGIVSSRLTTIDGWAKAATDAANLAISGIGQASNSNILINFPAQPISLSPTSPNTGVSPDKTITNNPTATSFFGTDTLDIVTPAVIPTPKFQTPSFAPSRPNTSLPTPPTAYPTVYAPTKPSAPAFQAPAAPSIAAPNVPTLLQINAPAVEAVNIQPFSVAAPMTEEAIAKMTDGASKAEALISSIVARADTVASSLPSSAIALKASLLAFATDGVAARSAVRSAAVADQIADIDRETQQKTDQLVELFAAKNFSIAPGMLVGAVNEAEAEGGRKIRLAASKVNQRYLQEAAEEYSALAGLFSEIQQTLATVATETLKSRVAAERLRAQSQMELFNATLAVFQSQQNIVNYKVSAYRAQLDATNKQSSTYKTAVDGAIAEIAENDAKLAIFTAQQQVLKAEAAVFDSQIQASSVDLDVYKASLLGYKAESDIVASNISAYRSAVQTYVSAVEAATSEVEAYAAQIQTNVASLEVDSTNVQAYSKYISEAAASVDVAKAFNSEQAEIIQANIRAFRDVAQSNEAFVRASAAAVSAQAEVNRARAAAHDVAINSYNTYNSAQAEYAAATTSFSLTSQENVARAIALANQLKAETDKIESGGLAAKAQSLSAVAQGVMSALHVSASAQASGSTSSNFEMSQGYQTNWGGSKSKSESYTTSVAGA